MTLKEAILLQTKPLPQATWCFILRGDNEILLAMKKRGFGVGKWNAPGGKVHPGELPIDTAARETTEEVGIIPQGLIEVARINFYFAQKPEWNQQVIGFLAASWTGEPTETEEMKPQWFKYSDIPYSQMWADDYIWLPRVLAGQKVTGDFLFGENNNIIEHNL